MAEQTTRSIIVGIDAAEAFAAWADFEKFPTFMKHVKSVQRTGANTTRWVASGPFGKDVEWDAETTWFEPGKRIGWNSRHGSQVRTSGQVTFNDLGNQQTEITVTFQYSTESAAAKLGGMFRDLDDMVDEALRNFKAYVESRVPARA